MTNPDARPSLWHDFETYSDLDLKKVGAYKYAMHPSTEVLMAAWAIDDGVVHSWDSAAGDDMPLRGLMLMLLDPQIKKRAFNATFEYLIAKHVLDLNVDINDYFCTMVHAWSLSFSGGLADVGAQVGVPIGKKKLATGSKLIARFCKPAPRNHNAVRYDHVSHPAEWDQFLEYNRQDVVAEREIALLFRPYPIHENERALWLLDAEINQRGVPVDRSLIEATLEASAIEKKLLLERMVQLTGLANPNSPVQLRTWLNEHGCALENMQKDTLTAELKYLDGEAYDGQLTYEQSQAYEGITLRQQASKTSTAKWVALKNAMMADDRLRGMFAFGAAQRTQRWGGRIVQLQNLPGWSEDPRTVAEMMLMLGHQAVATHYPPVMNAISVTVRCAITAPKGKVLVVADLAGIESRALGYLSGCVKVNQIFAAGKDVYTAFAVEALNKPYDEITKAERSFHKPPTLGGGFGLGWKGLIAYAEGFGVELSEDEARHLITVFRESYHEIPSMWYWLVDACSDVIRGQGTCTGFGVHITRNHDFMFIELPSGRKLAYFQPLIIKRAPPWEVTKVEESKARREAQLLAGEKVETLYVAKLKDTISYMGMDQYTKKWGRIPTTGGKLTENIVQAFARDILGVWLQRVAPRYDIVLHVHDELGVVVDEAEAQTALDFLLETSREPIPWAPDLLLDAAGFITKRYYKD